MTRSPKTGKPPTSPAECIYCRETTGGYKKGEHVIPQAFGKFGTDTWVLREVVCDDCNGHFGQTLEVFFNRGSQEALERFRVGLKPLNEAADVHLDRVSAVSVSGPTKGIKFCPVTRKPLPQVGLKLATTQGRDFFSLADFARAKPIDKSRYDLKSNDGILVLAENQEDVDRLVAALDKLGVAFKFQQEAPRHGPHRVEVQQVVQYDAITFRTIAKVAFNYMAKVRGSSYCLRSEFDPIRAFIRYGTPPPFTAAFPSNTPILALDTETRRHTDSHIIVLETQDDGSTVQARVSFFNNLTYPITMARSISKACQAPDIGHQFDWRNKKIAPLLGSQGTRS